MARIISPGEAAASLARIERDVERSSSKENAVIRAAVTLVARDGIDNLTVSGILTEAKVARGTVYAHFGDAMGVAASVWTTFGEAWLDEVLAVGIPRVTPALHRALVECLVIARREPQIMEVVQPDIQRAWSAAQLAGNAAQLRFIWTIAGVVGTELLRPVEQNIGLAEEMTSLISRMTPDVLPDITEQARALPDPSLGAVSPERTTDDPVTDRLMRGSISVVASAGFERASVLRIARAARLTPGAVNPRFGEILALHRLALTSASREVVEINLAMTAPFVDTLHPADVNTLTIEPALDEVRRTWRWYRNEMLLASAHHDDVAELLRESFAAANSALGDFVRSRFNVSRLGPVLVYNELASVGLSTVADLGLPVNSLDHRPVVRWLFDELVDTR